MTAPAVRPGWRDSLAAAADLAALGIVVFVACLPVLTAGAALAAGSVAVDGLCRRGALPSARELGRVFVQALLPGALATGAALAAAGLLALDLRLVLAGSIPGGVPVAVTLALLAAALLVLAALTLVHIGQTGGTGWRAAVGWSLRRLRHRPALVPAILATLAVATAIALLNPVLAVLLPGITLYALHTLSTRLSPRTPRSPRS